MHVLLPAGGSDPYWASCSYPLFTAFLIVNGVAFMLSVASAIVITAFPLLLNRTPHQAAAWGGILLLGSLIAFIVAFLLAGFVTVNYNAPVPGCASLSCEDGGISCVVTSGIGDESGGYFVNADLTKLNLIANNGSAAVCLRYNASVATNASVMTLVPYYVTCPGTNDNSDDSDFLDCPDVRQLLESDRVQQEVVCVNEDNFPNQLPTADLDNYTIPIDPSLLTGYTSLAQWYDADDENYITDLITDGSFQQGLFAYASFSYSCYSRGNDTFKAFNPLCNMDETLAVTRVGTFMTEATASVNGALVFGADATARQVAHAVEALAGFFGFVLLAIVVYLVKAKLQY